MKESPLTVLIMIHVLCTKTAVTKSQKRVKENSNHKAVSIRVKQTKFQREIYPYHLDSKI